MNFTFIGIGNVGLALATRYSALGHTITVAARDPRSESVLKAKLALPAFRTEFPGDAVREADAVFLATPFDAAEAAVSAAGAAMDGKLVLDCTNPVGAGPHARSGKPHRGHCSASEALPSDSVREDI